MYFQISDSQWNIIIMIKTVISNQMTNWYFKRNALKNYKKK